MWHWSNLVLHGVLWGLGGLYLFLLPNYEILEMGGLGFSPKYLLSFAVPIAAFGATGLFHLAGVWLKEDLRPIDFRMVLIFSILLQISFFLRINLRWLDAVAYSITMGVMSYCIYLNHRLPGVPINKLIGIRVPWTYNDPEIWDRTHRKLSMWMMPTFWLGLPVLMFPRYVWVYFATFLIVNLCAAPYAWWLTRQKRLSV